MIEVTASDVESAIEQGLAQLGLMRAEVKIEILEEGSRGVLGLGSRQCKVRLTPWEELPADAPSTARQSDVRAAAGDDDKEFEYDEDADEIEDDDFESDAADDDEGSPEEDGEPAPVIEGEGLAVEITQTILEHMGFRRAESFGRSLLPMDDADQPSITVEVEVEDRDEEAFLAHSAEGLNALQTLVQTMWSHQTKSNVRVNVDVNGYKARHQEKLVAMARRMAERVIETGRAVTLEPMNGADRRIVHMTLREFPGVFTESSGEGASRKVHIKPSA
jgi:spoIIIJ-associated protein